MATLINKANPQIRITAPEIGTGTHGYYYVCNVGYPEDKWTLVDEEPAHWKPSEKQILALRTTVIDFPEDKELLSLYEDLKKL